MKLTAMPKFYPTAIIQDCWSSIGDIQLTVPGMGSDPSKMRSYMPASAGPVEIGQTTSTRDLTFNLTQKGQSPLCAHIRYRLIDELTGYRNNWQRLPH